jgi:glycosyltransferase involved in cell wall biosynthesis
MWRTPTSGRVAVVCDAFLRVAVEQVVGFVECGQAAALVYTLRPAGRLGEFGENESERDACLARARGAGVDLIEVPVWSSARAIQDSIALVSRLRRKQVSVLVVHSHYDPRFALLGLLWRTLIVIHDPRPHSGDVASDHSQMARTVTRLAEAIAACVMLHSERLTPQLRTGLRRHPLMIIPHGCVPASNPLPRPRVPRCTVIGRMYYYKGVDIAAAAFRDIVRARPDCHMTIAGDGPEIGKLEAYRATRNFTVLDGYIRESEVLGILRDSTLVLLPYRDATQSGVGLKAIALGIPCVVSNVGALPDLVPAKLSGLVVAPEATQELASAVLAFIDHDDSVRRDVLDLATAYSWTRVAEAMLQGLREHRLLVSTPTT